MMRVKKKAGRDFIVQRDYKAYPLVIPYPGGFVAFLGINRIDTIVEKNNNHQIAVES